MNRSLNSLRSNLSFNRTSSLDPAFSPRRRRNARRVFGQTSGGIGSPARQNGLADFDKLGGVVRRKAEALEAAGFFRQQDVPAEIALIQFDSPGKTFLAAENGRADFDGHNIPRGNDEGVQEKPGLQFKPVSVDAVLLPQAFARGLREMERRVVHNLIAAGFRLSAVRMKAGSGKIPAHAGTGAGGADGSFF